MHVSPDRWKSNLPGGLDKLNTFFIPEEFDNDMPKIKPYNGDIPEELVPFRTVPNGNKAVHFFLDDYRFECMWNRPYVYAERYQDKTLLSPDYSLYANYPLLVQRWNTYRSRWLSAYFQSNDIRIIPTVGWSDDRSFDFCFDGIAYNDMVAISTRGCAKSKEGFSRGFDAMIEHIYPRVVLCAGDIRKVYIGDDNLENVVTYILERKSYCYKLAI